MSSLIIAIPSKGRLQDNTHAFFSRAGMNVMQPGGARNYQGAIEGLQNVEIAFLSASEIAGALSEGSAHFGITGLDLVHENISVPEERVHIISPLGFGPADVIVAVPNAWIDVETMSDLFDVTSDFRHRHGRRMRVATKYVNLTRAFFARHGIVDYRIVESAGATEGAPAAGSAELIVDITTTGSTLRANNLKILSDGTILKSQANLVASLSATWNETELVAARAILDRVAAEEAARNVKLIKAVVDDRTQALRAVSKVGALNRFSETDDHRHVTVLCPKNSVADCAKLLIAEGADTVTVETLDYVFSRENHLFMPLKEKLDTLVG